MNIGNSYSMHGKIETEVLSVVVAQFHPDDAATMEEVDKNVDRIIEYMNRAVAGFPGVDLIVTPEAALQGMHWTEWRNMLLTLDSPPVKRLCEACRELDVWGIFNPWLKPGDGRYCDNVGILVNNQGEIVLQYSKMNPWTPLETTNAGSCCPVAEGPKGSKIGIIICADGDYPEIWREAAFNGANVIVRISHYMSPWEQAMEITNKSGAYCNQTYVVSCSAVGVDDMYSYFGRSSVINPDGTTIIEAPAGVPALIKADLYPGIIDHMRKYSVNSNPLYTFNHRGASCPDYRGRGVTKMQYNAYKEEEDK